MESAQMMRFLYATFPLPTADFRIWKVAPAENAAAWAECRDRGCISIGWLADTGLPDAQDQRGNSECPRRVW